MKVAWEQGGVRFPPTCHSWPLFTNLLWAANSVVMFPTVATEAAKICGKQTCENIKNKLYQSVEEEVAQNMFEKAKEKMKSHFNNLKVEMTMKLEKDFSNMLSFAFSPWDRMCDRLPVFDQERQEIESLYNSLQ